MSVVNCSRIRTARSCPSKWHMTYERNLVPSTKAIPLIRGGSMHKALEVWYRTGDIELTLKAFEDDYRAHAEAGRFITEEFELIDQRIGEARMLLSAYAKAYPIEPWEMPRPEQIFKVYIGEACPYCGANRQNLPNPLTTPNSVLDGMKCWKCFKPVHVFIGRIDLLVSWKGAVWVVEHKTHAQVQANLLRSYARSLQAVGYVYGISKALNISVKGFLINILKTTKTPDFVRDIFFISEGAKQKFVTDLYETMEDVTRWSERKYWLQNTESCFDWGRACPYLPFCDRYVDLDTIPDGEIISMGFEPREIDYADDAYIKEDKRL